MSEKNKDLEIFAADNLTVSDEPELFLVEAAGQDGSVHKMQFPTTTTTRTIVEEALATTTTTLPPEALNEVTEEIESVRVKSTFISEMTLKILNLFSITVKRAPKNTLRHKIIK